MRKLTAVLTTLVTALAVLVIGGIAAPASAHVTSPANGAVLRGAATLSASGGYDDSTFDHCSWFGGDGGNTRIQLINSSGHAVVNQFWDTGGARSVTIDTHDFPNGSYTVRATEGVRKNSGFGGFGCKTETHTNNRSVTIDNLTRIEYQGDTSGPQNTMATVRAKLTDPHLSGQVLANRPVRFTLGSSTKTVDTNGSGIASTTLAIPGPPGSKTVKAEFVQTSYYRASSDSGTFTATKNDSTTTLATPAPVVHGQATTFSADVTAGNGTGVPDGTVQFKVDGANFGSPVDVVDGTAVSSSTSTLSTGSHTIGAVYSGDGNFFGSTAANKTQQVNKAQTTTVLTSTGSPTVSGETVTFTAEVAVQSPGTGTPEGAVQFNVDGQPAGTAVHLDGDTATLPLSNLAPGNHDVEAVYNGNADYATSSSAVLTHGVNRADTDVTLETSNAAAVAGEPLTFTADVSVVGPGAGNPSGDVQFAVDGVDLGGPVPLNGGSASSPVARLGAGSHQVTANYVGDPKFAGASESLTQAVARAETTTTVTTSPNPSVFGQPVKIRAEVAPVAPATGSPEGAIRFIVDGTTRDIVDMVDGAAELEVGDLSRGDHAIKAVYLSGDTDFNTSTSAEVTQTVNKAATRTDVVSSSPVSVHGQPVTFTATVSVPGPGAGAPTGTVTFTDGATVLGSAPVSSATGFRASITTDQLSVSQHAVVATYDGDDSFHGSNGTVIQKVNRAQTSTLVSSSANPSLSGQVVTFTAVISPVAPGAGEPTGKVQFTANGANLGGPVTVEEGVATSSAFASLTPGNYRIEAAYTGDGNFVASAGALDQGTGQDVVKGDSTMTIGSDTENAAYGEPVTFTATVDAVAPATGRPSGVVQFWEGEVLLGATSLSPDGPGRGRTSFVTSTLSPGSHEITAVYLGNYNFESATATVAQAVGSVPTVTGIGSSRNPAAFGDEVQLTAVVTEAVPAAGAPTGTVTFAEGSTVLGTAPLTAVAGQQQATITLARLGAGTHQVVATYSGGAGFATSESAPYAQLVQRAPSAVELSPVITRAGDNAGTVRARLTGVDGAPLAGQTLVFTTTQQVGTAVNQICTAVTDADGRASCHNTNLMPAVILNGGFDVDFHGNADYLPSTDHAAYGGGANGAS